MGLFRMRGLLFSLWTSTSGLLVVFSRKVAVGEHALACFFDGVLTFVPKRRPGTYIRPLFASKKKVHALAHSKLRNAGAEHANLSGAETQGSDLVLGNGRPAGKSAT